MKSKYWIALLGCVLVLCIIASIFLLVSGEESQWAEIWSDGKLIKTVHLLKEEQFSVESSYGTNVVTVKDGKIAVTEATCPDHYCMQRGFCSSGVQIVCLPNRLVIKFAGEQSIDGISG